MRWMIFRVVSHTYVGGDEDVFQFIEHFVVHLGFSGYGALELIKEARACLFQTLVVGFLVFLFW